MVRVPSGCDPAVTAPRKPRLLPVSVAVSAAAVPKVVTVTGIRNSPGVSVAVIATDGSRVPRARCRQAPAGFLEREVRRPSFPFGRPGNEVPRRALSWRPAAHFPLPVLGR